MAKSVRFSTQTGTLVEQDYPDKWTDEQIDADLAKIGAKREQSWGEWMYAHVVPQTPVEWAIFGATLPFGFGAGGAVARLGTVGGKSAISMITRKLATGSLARTAYTTAAGAGGAAYGQAVSEHPELATTLAEGAVQGFVAGLAGEGATKLVSGLNQVMMRRILERYKDPAAMNQWAREWMPEIQARVQTGRPMELQRLLLNHELHDAARAQLKLQIAEAARVSSRTNVVLPELNEYLKRAASKLPDFPAKPGAAFTVHEAMDYLTGAELNEHLYRVVADEIFTQVGPQASKALQTGLGRYGFYKEVERLLGDHAAEIWANNRMNLNPVRQAIMESAGPAGKSMRDKLGKSWDDLLQTVFRGDIPAVLDKPASIGVSGGGIGASGMPRAYFQQPTVGQRAGRPGALPGGMMAPLTAVPGAQLAPSLGGFIPGSLFEE